MRAMLLDWQQALLLEHFFLQVLRRKKCRCDGTHMLGTKYAPCRARLILRAEQKNHD
jgi:hypothetical protein